MEKKKEKKNTESSEFSSKIEEIVKQATDLVEPGSNNAVIIITMEQKDNDANTTVSFAGRDISLAYSVAGLLSNKDCRSFVIAGMGIAKEQMDD